MEDHAKQILETFDRLGLTRLGAADFALPTGTGARDAALAALVQSGCLREVAGQFERTEWGRLEIAGPLDLTFLSRSGCHLCEEALRQIEPLMGGFGAELRVVNVDTDRTLRERYGNEVPVIFLGSRELQRNRIDPGKVRAELSSVKRD
jgi:glutaredoxin